MGSSRTPGRTAQHHEPTMGTPIAKRADLDPATPSGQPDDESRHSESDKAHPVGNPAHDPRDCLRCLELALVDDLDLPAHATAKRSVRECDLEGDDHESEHQVDCHRDQGCGVAELLDARIAHALHGECGDADP
jgi:hypothetical protein